MALVQICSHSSRQRNLTLNHFFALSFSCQSSLLVLIQVFMMKLTMTTSSSAFCDLVDRHTIQHSLARDSEPLTQVSSVELLHSYFHLSFYFFFFRVLHRFISEISLAVNFSSYFLVRFLLRRHSFSDCEHIFR